MAAVDGLYSQQSFFFPGGIARDPVTLTFWRDDASARAFSYNAGIHRHQARSGFDWSHTPSCRRGAREVGDLDPLLSTLLQADLP